MANIEDYILWRGDLTVAQAPFNNVDNLILSNLVYLIFKDIVPELSYTKPSVLNKFTGFFKQNNSSENQSITIHDAIADIIKEVQKLFPKNSEIRPNAIAKDRKHTDQQRKSGDK